MLGSVTIRGYVGYNLNFLEGGYIGDYIGSVDYSSCRDIWGPIYSFLVKVA